MCGSCSCFSWSVTSCKRTTIAELTCLTREGKAQLWPFSGTSAGFRLSRGFQLLVQETQIAGASSPLALGQWCELCAAAILVGASGTGAGLCPCPASVPGIAGFPCPECPGCAPNPAQCSDTPGFGIPGLGWELELAAEQMGLVRVLEAEAWKYSLGSSTAHVITAG